MSALPAYQVSAYNTAKSSENKIHDDATAKRFGFKGGLVDDLLVFGRALTTLEAREVFADGALSALRTKDAGVLTSLERAELFDYFLGNHDEPFRRQRAALTEARATQTQLADEAKDLLKKRLGESSGRVKDQKAFEKSSDDSFPASDPPANY